MKCAFVLLALGCLVTAVHAQWLEETVYLPDSLSVLPYPSCITYSPLSSKVYVSGGIDEYGSRRVGQDCWVVVIDGTTDQRVKRIAVPSAISALCYDSIDNKVYAINYWDSIVSVIDAASDSVVAEVQLPCDPNFGLCWNGARNKVYLELNVDSAVAVVDCSSDSVTGIIQTVYRASMLVCAAEYDRVYCGGKYMSEVAAVDCKADTVCARFPLTSYPMAMCYDTSGGRVFIGSGNEVLSVDASSDTIMATTPVSGIVALSYNSQRNRLYCARSYDSVYVLDATTLALVDRLQVSLFGAKSLWCDSPDDRLYCAGENDGDIVVIDCEDNRIVAVLTAGIAPVALYPNSQQGKVYSVNHGSDDLAVIVGDSVTTRVAVGSRPALSCFNPTRNKVYVTHGPSGLVSVIDGVTNQVLANIRAGYGAYALCYASGADKVYCPSQLEGRVTVIDCATDSVVARIPAGTLPTFISYSPVQNRIYCSNAAGPDPSVHVIDCATDSVRSKVVLPGPLQSQGYHGMADKLYCGFEDHSPHYSIRAIACGPDTIVDTVPGTRGGCWDILSSPLYNKVYCDIGQYGEIAVVDGAADTIVRTIDLPGFVSCWSGACFSQRHDRLYLALSANPGAMWVMDAKTDSIMELVRSSPVRDVCYNATNDKVYAAVASDSVDVWDCASGGYIAQIRVGRAPAYLIWNSVSNKVYALNHRSGNVSIIRDSGGGVEEAARYEVRRRRLATVVRRVLHVPTEQDPIPLSPAVLLDATGRRVQDLRSGGNDVRALPPGVYFLRQASGAERGAPSVTKVVIQR
ncbi:hypothetical protein FJY68_03150 [candidate division WOR-3 bacterium]|uniref:YncE family protein n=1 Tax=candidate division WOR-3 bacterium TaxID=2052148 RepID=A0A937XG66_UNCW3|nr:hypothetical protein [candidate division WOR-3 bacterium]